MSLVQPPVPERRPSPSMEFATNNPFRARLSGAPISPASSHDRFSFGSATHDPPNAGRPQSRNPFLDVFDDDGDFDDDEHSRHHKANSFDASSSNRPRLTGAAAELFDNLTITDHSDPMDRSTNRDRSVKPQHRSQSAVKSRSHHHSRSSDIPRTLDDGPPLISIDGSNAPPLRNRRPPPPAGNARSNGGERSRDFDREPRRRPRRNSDSSVIDVHEAENKDRERRERRDRDGKRNGEGGSGRTRRDETSSKREGADRRKKEKGAPLDVIDKLDVTGIYGSGLFHHDGPFDACRPHRNKNTRKLAPVQAFPADSANNALTGFGPINAKADHSHVFGNRDPEAFHDFTRRGSAGDSSGRPSAARAQSFDPKAADNVHGDESLGLGTSTFLDGAPASRAAIQRNAAEAGEERPRSSSGPSMSGSLQRKKSLAQKIRSISQNRPNGAAHVDVPMPVERRRPPPPGKSSSPEAYSPITPGTDSSRKESNPFFNEYDNAYDKKGESINVVENERRRDRIQQSPRKASGGRPSHEKMNSNEGLLNRVRSLSKPKRRNE